MGWLRLYITVEGQTERQFADAIGLPVLRQKCPHFAAWLTCLEALQGEAQ